MGEILIEILEWMAHMTGKLILYAATFGRYRPKLTDTKTDLWSFKDLRTTGTTLVGVLFWSMVLVLVAWLVSH